MVPLFHLFWPPKDACTRLHVLQGIEIFTALYMCSERDGKGKGLFLSWWEWKLLS